MNSRVPPTIYLFRPCRRTTQIDLLFLHVPIIPYLIIILVVSTSRKSRGYADNKVACIKERSPKLHNITSSKTLKPKRRFYYYWKKFKVTMNRLIIFALAVCAIYTAQGSANEVGSHSIFSLTVVC